MTRHTNKLIFNGIMIVAVGAAVHMLGFADTSVAAAVAALLIYFITRIRRNIRYIFDYRAPRAE